MQESHQPRKVTAISAIGYGMGDLYGGGQGALVATYLALFWNRFCGMDIGLTQSVIGMSAILSAFAALGFGVLCDNLYRFRIGRRFGRRRLVLAFVAPAVLVGCLLWIPGLPTFLYCLVYVVWVPLHRVRHVDPVAWRHRALGGGGGPSRRIYGICVRGHFHVRLGGFHLLAFHVGDVATAGRVRHI